MQLTECVLLNEIEMSVLMICGIKAGDALKIKAICKDMPCQSAKTKLSKESVKEGTTGITADMVQNTEDDEVPREVISEDGLIECASLRTEETPGKTTMPSPFTYCEKQNRMFFKDYKLLEKFSPGVTYALEHNCLNEKRRSEFIRDICTDISSNGVNFLNKEERNVVSLAIVTRYPHLKDSIGSGLGSWSESIKNRFKHVRKYANKKRKLAESENGDQASSVVMVTPPQIGRPKKADFWNAVPICVGVTESIQKEHIAELHKEWNKVLSIQDSEKIKELMISTYDIRRRNILTTTILVHDIIYTYPPLATVKGIRQEYCRIMQDDTAMKDIKTTFSTYQGAIVKYCEELQRKSPFIKDAIRCLQEGIKEDMENAKTLENTCAVMLLLRLLSKKMSKEGSDLMEILCEDDDLEAEIKATAYPRIIGVGENLLKLDKAVICIEGKELVDVTSRPMDTVLFSLYATYYIFSIAYPVDHKDLFLFIDSIIVGIQQNA
ncbi:Hypothetical predicted protein [Paramuricea clavata]|uniref:Uncharacterized protein n=1 Tax=Paramuricea clavata TaxID=317549 RepID=A0A6S7G5F1_PARCT|nr:Hypothetical predicted protein [Paramuricea clavata]